MTTAKCVSGTNEGMCQVIEDASETEMKQWIRIDGICTVNDERSRAGEAILRLQKIDWTILQSEQNMNLGYKEGGIGLVVMCVEIQMKQ